jgi:Ca2+-binding EF-hand superfamily protein
MAACACDEKKQENYLDGLSPGQRMEAIKDIFIAADQSGDKLIDLQEWLKASKLQKKDAYNEEESTKEFKVIDQSNSGTISLAEFDLYVINLQMEGVRDRFKKADKSKDRKLDKKEFKAFFSSEGMKPRAINKLWKKCDKNSDGKVTYSEFSDWMEREMADGVLAETFGALAKKAEDEKAQE